MKHFIGLTINPNHKIYSENIKEVIELIDIGGNDYIEIVKHFKEGSKNNEKHFHAFIISSKSPNWWKENKIAHIESIKNVKAYIKYMNNHDKIERDTRGEMPYIEQTNDDIIDFLLEHGPIQTVKAYGWTALTKYKALKDFYEDYKEHIYINGK